jgi:hypothetical protein
MAVSTRSKVKLTVSESVQRVGANLSSDGSMILGGCLVCFAYVVWYLNLSSDVRSVSEFGLVVKTFLFLVRYPLALEVKRSLSVVSSSSYAGGQAYLMGLSHPFLASLNISKMLVFPFYEWEWGSPKSKKNVDYTIVCLENGIDGAVHMK